MHSRDILSAYGQPHPFPRSRFPPSCASIDQPHFHELVLEQLNDHPNDRPLCSRDIPIISPPAYNHAGIETATM